MTVTSLMKMNHQTVDKKPLSLICINII